MFKIHFMHIGHMSNKGTQGLFKTDVSIMREIIGNNIYISISTSDINGVKNLNLHLQEVFPTVIDIPYEKADKYAQKFGYDRDTIQYKIFTIMSIALMFIQAFLSVLSAIFIKIRLKGFYRSKLINTIKNSNLIISGSDEIFKETSSLLTFNFEWMITWWSMLFSRTWDVLVARFFGKHLIMLPNSVGPFNTLIGKTLSKLSLSSYDYLFIREDISLDIVKSLNIKAKKILTSDTALLLPNEICEKKFKYHNLIGICPGAYDKGISNENFQRYIYSHAVVLDKTIEKYGYKIFFIPHYIRGFKNDDLDISKLIIDRMKYKDNVKLLITNNVDEFKNILIQMDLVISSKMHPAVYSISEFTPTLCIAYDHKQIGFFKSLNLSDCVIPIQYISNKILWLKIEYILKNKNKIINIMKKYVPVLKTKQKSEVENIILKYINVCK